jgi:hypothetical protein
MKITMKDIMEGVELIEFVCKDCGTLIEVSAEDCLSDVRCSKCGNDKM